MSANSPQGVSHYENFPVASILCPPALRAPIAAIYHFARTADDIADEGGASAEQRLADLNDYEAALSRAADGDVSGRWQAVMAPLAQAIQAHALPLSPLRDLLFAFKQDTGNPVYATRTELLDYCCRSANPIGRLLLHLAGVGDARAMEQSDAMCSALQLINFWQDLSVDLPRGRHYVTDADLAAHSMRREQLALGQDSAATRALVQGLVAWARSTMLEGAPLVHCMPGRMGWELRLVVQGGLRILEKIEHGGCNALTLRPTVSVGDAPRLLWRAWMMKTNTRPTAVLSHDT
jgi:hydroxysqualene synthase